MNTQSARFFVLTGGPGSGKTTLIDHLTGMGYHTVPEAGRTVIRQQYRHGGVALPWKDKAAYGKRMHEYDMAAYQRACNVDGPVFFDRGIVDVIAYLHLEQLPLPASMRAAAWQCRYHCPVFILPPWPEIYRSDQERRQDLSTAIATYDAMMKTYAEYGYELVQLPRLPVAQRAAFLLDLIALRHDRTGN